MSDLYGNPDCFFFHAKAKVLMCCIYSNTKSVKVTFIDSSCMTNIKILPHKMADFVCVHWVNCISEYSKVKLERNYVQLFYCQPLTSLRTTHLIR